MTLADWANMATIGGGAAAVLGLLFAVWQVTAWKVQRRTELRSIAASRALVALTRANDAIVTWASGIEDILHVEDPEMDFGQLLEDVETIDAKGRASTELPLQDLHAATPEVGVHLDEEAGAILRAVYDNALEMREVIDAMRTEVECVPGDEALYAVQRLRAAVREGREFSQQQLLRASLVLVPIARLGARPSWFGRAKRAEVAREPTRSTRERWAPWSIRRRQ